MRIGALIGIIVLIGLFTLGFSGSALASEVGIGVQDTITKNFVNEDNPLSICAKPLTPKDLRVFVANTGPDTDTYRVSITPPEGWEGKIKDTLVLASGEEQDLNLFVLNPPMPWEIEPGRYVAMINVESESDSNHKAEYGIIIDILPCYAVEVEAVTEEKTVCEEKEEQHEFKVKITNAGKFTDTFSVTTSVDWAGTDQTLELEPQESRTISIMANPPRGLFGEQKVKVFAKSDFSKAEAETEFTLKIENCYDFSLTLEPSAQDICIGKKGDYTLTINNLGKEDTITLNVPEGVGAGTAIVKIGEGQTKTIALDWTPNEIGEKELLVQASSGNDPETVVSIKSGLNVLECKSVSVALTPIGNADVCAGEIVTYEMIVENTGAVEDTYILTSDMGTLEKEEITLGAGKKDAIGLVLETIPGVSGERIVTVTAQSKTSEAVKDSAGFQSNIENCYFLQLEPLQERVRTCPGQDAVYKVNLHNVGTRQDTYRTTLGDDTKQIVIEPGKMHSFDFVYSVPMDAEPGISEIKIMSESDHFETEIGMELEIRDFETCYKAEVLDGEPKSVLVYRASAFPLMVKNHGESAQDFTLSVEGPEWTYTSPETLHLEGGEEKEGFFYVEPPLETPFQDYEVKVIAESAYTRAELPIKVSVVEKLEEGQDQGLPSIPIVPTEPQEPAEIETPGNEETPPVTGLIIGDYTEQVKIIVVAAIIVIVILILLLRVAIRPGH